MSGGSLDYFCYKVDDCISALSYRKEADVKAVVRLLCKLRPMMRAIEWHMSCDTGRDDEQKAIKEFFSSDYELQCAKSLKKDLESMKREIDEVIKGLG
jgi:hypothetical protein